MIQIFHNPRCQKSREGISLLEESGKDFEIIKYLDTTLTIELLTEVIQKLGIKPIDLIRQKEELWKENFSSNNYSDKELLQIMITHPKLIERPIIINGNKAVIGRPLSKIIDII